MMIFLENIKFDIELNVNIYENIQFKSIQYN